MALITYHTVRKSYCYNFYLSRAEEEGGAPNTAVTGSHYKRTLVEIRDVHPLIILNPHSPWQIKKTLNHYEIASGKIIVSFNDTFNYILRYWNSCMADYLAISGYKIGVIIWDVTNVKNPRKHKGKDIYLQITPSENYILTCMRMMRERNLKADDEIGLYWDTTTSCFNFKCFY
ncbi:hypothetical protein ACS0TY_003157 [Phlomoides rotata]